MAFGREEVGLALSLVRDLDDNVAQRARVVSAGLAAPRMLSDRFNDAINYLDMPGSARDGGETEIVEPEGIRHTEFIGTDNTEALQAALDYAASEHRPLWIPPGAYRCADHDGTDNFVMDGEEYTIIGYGAKFLIDDLGPSASGSALFGSTITSNRSLKRKLHFIGLTFQGAWHHFDLSEWNGSGGRRVCIVYGFDELVFENCHFLDIRSQAINSWACNSARATGCTFKRVARAGIRFNDTPDIDISGNIFAGVDDDAIACAANAPGQVATTNTLRGRINIRGNTFFQSGEILLQGGRITNVIGNHFLHMKATAVRVGSTVNVPSITPYAINIQGNTIENTLSQPDPDTLYETLLDADDGVAGIIVDGVPQSAASTDAMPGWATGTSVVDPRGKDNDGVWLSQAQNASRAAGFGINISNNLVHHTCGATTNYSDYGYGPLFTSRGWKNPEVTETKLARHGVSLVHDVRGAIIAGNIVTGHRTGAAVFLNFANTTDNERTFRDIMVTGNIGVDVREGISTSRRTSGGGATQVNIGLVSRGNTWDCDPYLKSARRKSDNDGSWQSGTTATDMVTGINLRGVQGAIIEGDVIRNCVEPIHAVTNVHVRAQVSSVVVCCDPAATGFSTSNKGVGNVPPGGPAFTHQILYCDATDATNFGRLKNNCPLQASAMPDSGTWVVGTFVHNAAPSIGTGKVLRGWARLTTGSAHVADTDWAAVYGTNS